ncbi:hypothetical protein GGS20DRAFT_572168 [Poronia punctata]|nr:hypothetical protein GGS20DRAFT_572168 [Poronia punctata]
MSGLPPRLKALNNYRDTSSPEIFVSPDQDENFATRGHIFIMDQTCIDLKIARQEKTHNLTFRPVYRDIPALECKIVRDGAPWVKAEIVPRVFSVM